ncbi:sarcosine oxidase subunit alpha family protein [Achromobacter spanius]|uniref:Sarcosine oxidase subunit alpha n=1 Tax=Achromobacter spanius TaxID=217203 RepID=A0AAW3I5Y5_9BURK|nr:sarcosine oxidase subunit alpha family protein [Achromobacter spanius]KNE27315.1 sarcosine oxidase subunit alpha [Achromobacter spanius]
MTQSNRLARGVSINPASSIEFTFNGRTYYGCQGDTLASALLANGEHFVARSWKYHRPRGIMTAGVEEPNALVQLEEGGHTVPNPCATTIELYDGLRAVSVNAAPDLERDRMAVFQRLGRFIPAGFYYKTFMWPKRFWPHYERLIRKAGGLGRAPRQPDPDHYDKRYAHCDVLVVGGGPAGLAAAMAAAMAGARVMLVDNQPELGGSLLSSPALINGAANLHWIRQAQAELQAMKEVRILTRSTAFGYHDQNLVTVCEQVTDHLPLSQRRGVRQRLWKVRARQVVLTTGAHERPLLFGNNDLPGIMLASAVSTYVRRFAVLPGRRVVLYTNNDGAYRTALDLREQGANVTVVDPRPAGRGALPDAVRSAGIDVRNETVVLQARGGRQVSGVVLAPYTAGRAGPPNARLPCDLVAMSGGWNPALHLHAQSGGQTRWDDVRACFVPDGSPQAQASAGAANGEFSLAQALHGGVMAGELAASRAGVNGAASLSWRTADIAEDPLLPIWQVADGRRPGRGAKQFVDYQNDVTVADIHLAVREGYHSVEHVKRYTAMGFGTDQGKLGNINGAAVLAAALGQTIAQTGTTTYRPNYTPITFGALAGCELGDFFDPIRKTCLHEWHVAHGAVFEDVGNWKRPWYFPLAGESMQAAVARECLAVRNGVGMLDASTLGKIDVQGPDAATLLNWVYTNLWTKLEVGKGRYGLMLDENGMVFDDGVTMRLGEQHYLMSTTTGGAARVLTWMERWLQTEWPHLDVHLTSVTDHFATFAVAGPRSREVLRAVCPDIDFSNAAFPFMTFREGTVAGAGWSTPARIMRISFSGELSYEVNVPANLGQRVWNALMEAGHEYGITPYGTEAMHVLRAEKGYIIVGQDTDGSVTPQDLGMGGMVAKSKDCLGKRSLSREHTASSNRKQFVGLLSRDPAVVLPEGSQVMNHANRATMASIMPMVGHVTSSYMSPTLNRSIALALVQDGQQRMGQQVEVALPGGGFLPATIGSPVFYDPEGARQHVD